MAAICLYYNPQGALQSLEQLGATASLFQTFFSSLSETMAAESEGDVPTKTHFRGLHDQKIVILGLTSLLKVPVAQLPPSVSQGLPTVVSALVTLQTDLAVNRKRRDEEEDEDEEEDDTNDNEEGVLDVADDEDEDDDGEEDLDAVLRKIAALKDSGDGMYGGDSMDGEDEDEYISPVDDVDEVLFFVEVFMGWQAATPPDVAAQISAQLAPATSSTLQEIIASVPARQAMLAQKKAEEAAKAAGEAGGKAPGGRQVTPVAACFSPDGQRRF